jgi:hypothetical protein
MPWIGPVAVVAEHAHFVGEATAQEAAMRHHPCIARRRNDIRDERAKCEILARDADQLFPAEGHLEAARAHLHLPIGAPVDEHIPPSAPTEEIALYLELEMVANLTVDAAAADAPYIRVLIEIRIEAPPVVRELQSNVNPHMLAQLD